MKAAVSAFLCYWENRTQQPWDLSFLSIYHVPGTVRSSIHRCYYSSFVISRVRLTLWKVVGSSDNQVWLPESRPNHWAAPPPKRGAEKVQVPVTRNRCRGDLLNQSQISPQSQLQGKESSFTLAALELCSKHTLYVSQHAKLFLPLCPKQAFFPWLTPTHSLTVSSGFTSFW